MNRMVEYIEASLADTALANRLAHEVLGRSLDELPPQTRRVLTAVIDHVRDQARVRATSIGAVRFTRKEIQLGKQRCPLAITPVPPTLDPRHHFDFGHSVPSYRTSERNPKRKRIK